MHKTILLLLIVVAVASAIVCPPNYCNNVECKSVTCSSDQKKVDQGTFCGCCPACRNFIKKGGSCTQLLLRGGPPPSVTCADGLHCNPKTAKCE